MTTIQACVLFALAVPYAHQNFSGHLFSFMSLLRLFLCLLHMREFSFPSFAVVTEAKDLIRMMLKPCPSER